MTDVAGLARSVAIVGVGETDYGADYRAAKGSDGEGLPDSLELGRLAFERALDDSGLEAADIDGVSIRFIYGDAGVEEVVAATGTSPRFAESGTGMPDRAIPEAVQAVAAGRCDTIALVYAAAPRSARRVYGGTTYGGGEAGTPTSYYYFNPWGWSSQAAHWALVFRHYQNAFGVTEEDLASVAITLRRHAADDERSVMRSALDLEGYLAARYIVRPLRVLDLCLVNNGAVCLILRRRDRARGLRSVPVDVAGWGDAAVASRKLEQLVIHRLGSELRRASVEALRMAGLSLGDVGHYQGYDASSIHLISQLEGLGFVEPGTGLAFCRDGQMDIGGLLPTNTNGGMLSQAYMHGWNNVAEAVHQLRHDRGSRQIAGLGASMVSLATTDTAHALVLTRGA